MLNFEINKFLSKTYVIKYKYSFQNLFSLFFCNVLRIITSSSSKRRPFNSREGGAMIFFNFHIGKTSWPERCKKKIIWLCRFQQEILVKWRKITYFSCKKTVFCFCEKRFYLRENITHRNRKFYQYGEKYVIDGSLTSDVSRM